MLHIAVCDDEPIEIEYLTACAQEWARERKTAVKVSSFASAEAFLFQYAEDKSFVILLLDIQMQAMDGIALAEKIRESDSSVQIVFITGFPDHISRGYDVSALHYLLKPVDKEKLFAVLSKASDNLKRTEKCILISVENESFKIHLKDIFFIEAFGHTSCVICENGEYRVKLPISDVAKMLDGSFVQCHRSYIANLEHISGITKTDIVLDNGKRIPVPRRMYNDVNMAFINFYRGIHA
ncbi:MAG: LytR/AlgR family response regulator transcription factor [Acutalibacteraceae bacterium]